jgi:hypothetical protein
MQEDKLDIFDNIFKQLSDLEQNVIDLEFHHNNKSINNKELNTQVHTLLDEIDTLSSSIDSFQETYKDLDMSEQLSEVLMRCEHYLLNLQKVPQPVKKSVATKKAKPKKMSVKKQIK